MKKAKTQGRSRNWLFAEAKSAQAVSPNANLFLLLLLVSFLLILVYNVFTPMLSDDFTYGAQVKEASNWFDLVRQEADQYMHWTGRSVVHMILRTFLFLPGPVFKVCNSLAFIALSLLIYAQIDGRRKWDVLVFAMIQLSLWLFTVDFKQSILWETGACNYLWGTMIILAFMTASRAVYRRAEAASVSTGNSSAGDRTGCGGHSSGPKMALTALGLLLLGIIAGWCNENTSGGALLYVLYLLAAYLAAHKKVHPVLAAGTVGTCIGLFMMVHAPGNYERMAYKSELHSGLYGLFSRFEKITESVQEYFLVLLILYMAACVIVWLQNRHKSYRERLIILKRPLLFGFLFLATSYALILTVQAQTRALFGAGIFLIIGTLQAVVTALRGEKEADSSIMVRSTVYAGVLGLGLYMAFTYIACGADNARIFRDVQERISYIEQQKAAGEDDITVAQVHTDFYNRYSAIQEMELQEDPGFWTNVGYEQYYGVKKIRAIPYVDWAVKTGQMTEEEAETARELMDPVAGSSESGE